MEGEGREDLGTCYSRRSWKVSGGKASSQVEETGDPDSHSKGFLRTKAQ